MPFFNPFREDRMRRMQELIAVLQRQKEVDLDWILGWGGVKWGSTESSLMAMLIQLDKARIIEIDNEGHKVKCLLRPPPEEKKTEETKTTEKEKTKPSAR